MNSESENVFFGIDGQVKSMTVNLSHFDGEERTRIAENLLRQAGKLGAYFHYEHKTVPLFPDEIAKNEAVLVNFARTEYVSEITGMLLGAEEVTLYTETPNLIQFTHPLSHEEAYALFKTQHDIPTRTVSITYEHPDGHESSSTYTPFFIEDSHHRTRNKFLREVTGQESAYGTIKKIDVIECTPPEFIDPEDDYKADTTDTSRLRRKLKERRKEEQE